MKPLDTSLLPEGMQAARVTEWREGCMAERADWLAEEVPVALVFNGISHAVMLASPSDLDDFALGFALTEGLIDGPGELYSVEIQEVAEGIELQLEVSSACTWRLKERRRTLAGRTGCGLCGTDSLAQVQRVLPKAPEVFLGPAALARAQRELRAHQAVQQLTGAMHAAAWCGLDGCVRLAREDIGRHNALDKLIGAMLRAGENHSLGFVTLTSRATASRWCRSQPQPASVHWRPYPLPLRWQCGAPTRWAWRWPASCAARTAWHTHFRNVSDSTFMNIDTLAQMVSDIGQLFDSMPDIWCRCTAPSGLHAD